MTITRVVPTTGTVAALLLGAVVAGVPAAAQEPTTVFVAGCDFEGGAVTVPAGTIDLELTGWGTGPRGALVHWLKSQDTTLTLRFDGHPATTQDITDSWGEPVRNKADKSWFSILSTDPVTLQAGESVLVSFESTWSKPTIDFFFGGGHPVLSHGGEISASCLITAE
jgi:hypothetical protein